VNNIPLEPAAYREWWEANTEIPYGYCWCGCGEKPKIASRTDRTHGTVAGEPKRLLQYHRYGLTTKKQREAEEYRRLWIEAADVSYGYCWCGCGNKTSVSSRTHRRYGWAEGEPMRYIQHHQWRNSNPQYVEEDRGYATPCWIWQWSKNDLGYGWAKVGSTSVPAHRLYYEREYGLVPSDLVMDHLCRVPSCVNPDHVEPVTQLENVRRGAAPKLTLDKAREIRRLYSTGRFTHRSIAPIFGVGKTTIGDIISGRLWPD
jgi:hypothetical protein